MIDLQEIVLQMGTNAYQTLWRHFGAIFGHCCSRVTETLTRVKPKIQGVCVIPEAKRTLPGNTRLSFDWVFAKSVDFQVWGKQINSIPKMK